MPAANPEAGLERLLTQIRQCRACVEAPKTKPLPHDPRPVVRASTTARLAIVGQAPGIRVHKSGLPFDDPSGDRLREWMGIGRETFYDEKRLAIVPMGFCFPGYDARGSDLPPRRECADLWRERLFGHLPQLELLLVIGQYAQAWHLGADRGANLTETVRNWASYRDSGRHPAVLPLPHPSWRNNSWLRKNPWFETDVLPHLRNEVARLAG